MKLINASYHKFDIPTAVHSMNGYEEICEGDVYRHLELIGRVCYKSEDKITDASAVKYLNMLKERKHWAMLEHFIFVMAIDRDIYNDIKKAEEQFPDDWMLHNKLKFIDVTYYDDPLASDFGWKYIVSGSATSFNYIWECPSMVNNVNHGLIKICRFLYHNFPGIMRPPIERVVNDVPVKVNHEIYDGIILLSREDIEMMPKQLRLIHDSMSVKFTTNLGVSHDIVRSRPCSWAMESTRWINYSKKCGYTYTIPLWFTKEERDYLTSLSEEILDHIVEGPYQPMQISDDAMRWITHLKEVEKEYNYFSKEKGYVPDQVSLLLPKNYKTELTLTARLAEWKHFFFLRAAKDVRPDVRELMVPLLKECIKNDPDIFADQQYQIDEIEGGN